MDDKRTAQEDVDDGTSLEVQLEKLDRNSPEYESKRAELLRRLQEVQKQLKETQLVIRKQLKDMRQTLKAVRQEAAKNPDSEELQNQAESIRYDREFLIRAAAEMIALRGNIKEKAHLLQRSQEYNQPVDVKAAVAFKVKPLPSSRIDEQKNRAKKEVNQNQNFKQEKRRKNNQLGRYISSLRVSSVPHRSYRVAPRERSRARA
jgi:hypothetical protein